jgi:hypothetical protein
MPFWVAVMVGVVRGSHFATQQGWGVVVVVVPPSQMLIERRRHRRVGSSGACVSIWGHR